MRKLIQGSLIGILLAGFASLNVNAAVFAPTCHSNEIYARAPYKPIHTTPQPVTQSYLNSTTATPSMARATVFNTLDECFDCQAYADAIISYWIDHGGSACQAYGDAADYCIGHCSPCSFCVRYSRIAMFYCSTD